MKQDEENKAAVAVRSSAWLGDEVDAALARMSMPSTHPALWITCSPHEWTWKQSGQEEMARDCVNFAREIHRLRQLVQTERAIARGAQENATGFREICERQEGEIKAARAAIEGFNPKEKRPEEGERVICEYKGVIPPVILTYGNGGFGCPWLGDHTRTPVTRWWPLPGQSPNDIAETRPEPTSHKN